jgi:hypothetical protein
VGVTRLQQIPGLNIDRLAAAIPTFFGRKISTPTSRRSKRRWRRLGRRSARRREQLAAVHRRDDLKEAVADYRAARRFALQRLTRDRDHQRRRRPWVDALFSLTAPGDEILTDPMYAEWSTAFGSSEQLLALSAFPREGEWRLDLEALGAGDRGTRDSSSRIPSLPTGWVASEGE